MEFPGKEGPGPELCFKEVDLTNMWQMAKRAENSLNGCLAMCEDTVNVAETDIEENEPHTV